MQLGYPEHVSLDKMINEFKLMEEKFNKWSASQSNFYSKVLLAFGFKLEDFKMGKNSIFFRPNKIRLLEDVFRNIIAISNSKLLLPEEACYPK